MRLKTNSETLVILTGDTGVKMTVLLNVNASVLILR